MLFIAAWIAIGIYSYQKLPIDAVPDITNTQVQINTSANGLALKWNSGLHIQSNTVMKRAENGTNRSISRYGLS